MNWKDTLLLVGYSRWIFFLWKRGGSLVCHEQAASPCSVWRKSRNGFLNMMTDVPVKNQAWFLVNKNEAICACRQRRYLDSSSNTFQLLVQRRCRAMTKRVCSPVMNWCGTYVDVMNDSWLGEQRPGALQRSEGDFRVVYLLRVSRPISLIECSWLYSATLRCFNVSYELYVPNCHIVKDAKWTKKCRWRNTRGAWRLALGLLLKILSASFSVTYDCACSWSRVDI